jgi:alcohol dehydrogenase class IV
MLPKIALIDPELTIHLPPGITAATGMDALTQVIEPYLTRKANPLTDAICVQAISIARKALLTSYLEPDNLIAREQMSLVSLFGGLALANSGLGVVHGFAAAIGGMYPNVRHGQICAAILPSAFIINRRCCEGKTEFKDTIQRMEKISSLLSEKSQMPAEEVLADMAVIMKIPGLSKLGIKRSGFKTITEKAAQSSSMKGNPIQLSSEDLLKILEMSY